MIDTSVIVDNPYNLVKLSEGGKNKLYLTETVIGEMDKHKTSPKDEVAIAAREFFRGMQDQNFKEAKKLKRNKKGDKFYKNDFTIDNETITLNIIVRKNYEKETLSAESVNDAKIREVAKTYKMICITNDISFKFLARAEGLKAESIYWDSVKSFDDIIFTETIRITEENFKEKRTDIALNLNPWTQLTIEYIDEEGNLTGKKEFFIVTQNGLMDITSNDYKRFEVKPLNLEQKFYVNMLESNFNIMTVSGSTGSGKTLLALQEGMRRVKDKNSNINGIVYMRFTVNAEDKFSALGYRKGNDDQKLDRFNYPLYNAINFIVDQRLTRNRHGLEKENVLTIKKNEMTDQIIKDYNIEFLDIASARGVTIENKYVIFDEIQNAPNMILRLIGTRLGKNSVFVLMGDPKQVDHPYLTPYRNGLITMLKSTKEDKSGFSAAVKLIKTVRSETSKWFEENIEG